VTKVGIASADIYDHSVWNAIVKGWVSRLDTKQFEIQLFKLGGPEDAQSRVARNYARRFEYRRRSLVEWSQCIADSDLDVLIYPAIGMDALTTQLASQRLARVQAASWGHPDTSGLPTMDYYISAESLEPPAAEANYSEKLVALPNLGVYYEPTPVAANVPNLAALGVPDKVPLLLCPGMPFKYTPKYDRIWVEIAKRTQPARLVFFRPRDSELATQFACRLETAFKCAGLDYRQCVSFIPFLGRAQFYGLMKTSALLLDSPGFSGFNTTMQAVECGLPFVSLEGAFLRGRLGSGILRQLGMDQLVASDADAYIDLAASLVTGQTGIDSIKKEFGLCAPKVFSDSTPIAALERFLASV
jgi:predicted O-linked N-acetylglucosamine transferase (SPINDLY family)